MVQQERGSPPRVRRPRGDHREEPLRVRYRRELLGHPAGRLHLHQGGRGKQGAHHAQQQGRQGSGGANEVHAQREDLSHSCSASSQPLAGPEDPKVHRRNKERGQDTSSGHQGLHRAHGEDGAGRGTAHPLPLAD